MNQFLFMLLLILPSFVSEGQDYESVYFGKALTNDVPTEYSTMVHSLDDFFARCNGYHNAYGKPIDQDDPQFKEIHRKLENWVEFRRKIIGSFLIDSLREYESENFANSVARSPNLDFYSTDWFITAPFVATLDNCSINGQLILKINEELGESRWIFDSVTYTQDIDVEGLMDVNPEFCEDDFIPPSSHDNGFIAISKILDKGHSLNRHMIRNGPDLRWLIDIVENGCIEIDWQYLEYHFRLTKNLSFATNDKFQIIKINHLD